MVKYEKKKTTQKKGKRWMWKLRRKEEIKRAKEKNIERSKEKRNKNVARRKEKEDKTKICNRNESRGNFN
jgi:hypothetical protein